MESQKLKEYLEKVESAIASDNDIKNLVDSIENGIKTTQNNYGKYYKILSQYASDKAFCYGMGLGLIKLKGNRQGILSALKLIIG